MGKILEWVKFGAIYGVIVGIVGLLYSPISGLTIPTFESFLIGIPTHIIIGILFWVAALYMNSLGLTLFGILKNKLVRVISSGLTLHLFGVVAYVALIFMFPSQADVLAGFSEINTVVMLCLYTTVTFYISKFLKIEI